MGQEVPTKPTNIGGKVRQDPFRFPSPINAFLVPGQLSRRSSFRVIRMFRGLLRLHGSAEGSDPIGLQVVYQFAAGAMTRGEGAPRLHNGQPESTADR